MADKKPDSKKPAPPASGGGHMFELELKIFLVVAFILIIYLATGKRVLQALGYSQLDPFGYFSNIVSLFKEINILNLI